MVRQRSPGNSEKNPIADGGRLLQNRKSKKMGRVGSPSGPKIQARMRRLRQTQILPQRRRDAEEGILGILGILQRRAEIRVNQGLTRRHEATKKIRCKWQSSAVSERSSNHANRKKWVGAARRADPSLRRERAVSPKPNPPAEAPGRRGGNFGNTRNSATLLCRSS